MKGIFIPNEFLEDANLSFTEAGLLAIYKYYTENGTAKCCTMTNESIYTMLGVSEKTFHRMKKRLKDLDYIKTNGGIAVWYVSEDKRVVKMAPQGVVDMTVKGGKDDTPLGKNDSLGVVKMTAEGGKDDTHNKEKRNKENNKEEKGDETIFDRVISQLSEEYRTPDKIKFLLDNYGERISRINDSSDDCNIELLTTQVKTILFSQYSGSEVVPASRQDKGSLQDEVLPRTFDWSTML